MGVPDIQFASIDRLLWEVWEGLLPPKRLSLAQWVTENRYLSNTGGGYVGRWQHEMAPYLTEIMECLAGDRYLTVAAAAPGQSGKTEVGHNYMLYSVDADPGDFLWYMQTDASLEAHVKAKIDPMILAHDQIRERLGAKPSDNTLNFKRFRGMSVQLLAATYSNLINKSAPRIVADEVDAYDPSLGDVKALLDIRRQTFGRMSKLLLLSHMDRATGLNPDKDWNHGIMAVYKDSDRRTWWWQCPYCNGHSSPNPNTARHMELVYPIGAPLDEVQEAARLRCPCCDEKIEDHWRREMNAIGRWLRRGEHIDERGVIQGAPPHHDTAGFWITGTMSPFVLGGIGALARAREKARREFEESGDDKTLRQVVVKQWGVPYSPPRRAEEVDAQALADRASPALKLGVVPEGVRFVTAAADAQAKHFEVIRRGWGVDGESWVISHQRIPADPASSPEDWLDLFAELMRPVPLGDGSGRVMQVRCAVFDAYGSAGFTERAYEAWMRWRQKGLVKRIGVIDGRHAWSLLPSKGEGGASGRLQVVYPEARSDRRAANGQVPVALFNTDSAKDDLTGQLRRILPGAGYVNFPADLATVTPDFFEQLTAETRSKAGRWSKRVDGARNEALDLMVGSHIAARLHGIRRLNWARPPAWAAEWDQNSLVVLPEPEAKPEETPAAPLPGLSAVVAAQARATVQTNVNHAQARARRYA